MSELMKADYRGLLERVSNLLEQARHEAVRRVNMVIVEAYWEIGRLIVEEEQKGRGRAAYGKRLLQRLSNDLTKRYGRGFSTDNLEAMRKFYLIYPSFGEKISETVSRKLAKPQDDIPEVEFLKNLSWSHIREIIRIEEPLTRSFYAIEAIKNNWSVRELKRQKGSLLFERLALSKDKKKVMELAERGQIIEKPEDMARIKFSEISYGL